MQASDSSIVISVVTPVYNGLHCVEELHRRLVKALEEMGLAFEIIMVNDACPEGSWRVIEKLAQYDHRLKAINLSRNFGQHYAITAGIDHARGDWIVVLDCDLQHPPEEIPRLYQKALEGHEVVFARRASRVDPFLKRVTSWLFVRLLNQLSDIKFDNSLSSFSLISRKVGDIVRSMRESSRSYALLLTWLGFEPGFVEFHQPDRFGGQSAYTWRRMARLATETIVSQSNRPLRISIRFGFGLAAAAFLYGLFLAIRYFTYAVPVQGWTSVMVSLFFLFGVLFCNIGILGLYLGKVFDESKGRPLYVIRDRLNIEDSPHAHLSHNGKDGPHRSEESRVEQSHA